MHDLFAPAQLSSESFASRKLSVVPVRGDAMSPTLRGEWDYVLAAPVKRFAYDTLYVIDVMGTPCVLRVQSHGNGQLALIRDNERYGPDRADLVSGDWFNEHVLGIVVCDLKVRDHDLMHKAWA
jgi:hypothetical protein